MNPFRRAVCIAAALLCILVLLPSLTGAEEAARNPQDAQMLEQVRQSVVHLYGIGYDSTGKLKSRWTGTGFAVGTAGEESDILLTNWHVVTGSGKFSLQNVRIWILLDNARFYPNKEPMPGTCLECNVLAAADGHPDVAVLQTSEPSGCKALPLLSSRRVTDGTEVYALGFPGLQATHYGKDSGPEDLTITAGNVANHMRMARAGYTHTLIHTADIQHGNSGGPLVNAQGAVIGLNTYGFEESVTTDYFCAVYIDYGIQMLEELGIACTVLPGPSHITVFVANALHMPQIGVLPAHCIFALVLLLCVLFALCFLKTLRETAEAVLEKLRKKRADS